MPFDSVPRGAKLKLESFTAHVSDQELDDFKALLRLSRIGPKTYENQVTDVKDYRGWGISREWLEGAKDHWLNRYDWRKTEDRINSFNNYTVAISDDTFEFKIHFIAMFSKKADAAPLLIMHGWPGSFLEFLGMLEVFRKKYSEENLPCHLIVPSLPGYGYSNGPPLDRNFDTEGIARVMDRLMVGLGFGDGYITQGGDIGSFVSRVLAVKYPSCKACHLNLCIGLGPENEEEAKQLDEKDQKAMKRITDFGEMGNAYAREHGTRPATVGLVLASNPVATLAWIGEKFQQWTDKTPPIDEILDGATLYWFTESFPRAIYPYREFFGPKPTFFHNDPAYFIKKPLGYSWHPEELAPTPVKFVPKSGNLVWHREHKDGGHFAAMEKPEEFVQDMEDFAKEVWAEAKNQ